MFSHHDRFMVYQAKDVLDAAGIPCFIKNEYAIGGMGELAPFDTQPEVWLSDSQWLPRAQALLKQIHVSEEYNSGVSWVCSKCEEQNEANFDICWQCGNEKK